jgi:hypothetical protein
MTEAEWLEATDPEPMLEFVCGGPLELARPWYARRRAKGGPRASDRRLRLLACALARAGASQLLDWDRPDAATLAFGAGDRDFVAASRRAVATAERYADGLCAWKDLSDAGLEAMDASTALLHRYVELLSEGRRPDRVMGFRQLTRLAEAATATDAGRAAGEACHVARWEGRGGPPVAGRAPRGWWDADPNWRASLVREVIGNPFRPVTADAGVLGSGAGVVVELAAAIYTEGGFNRAPDLADALEDAGCTDAELLGHLRGPGPHVRGCWALDLVLGRS